MERKSEAFDGEADKYRIFAFFERKSNINGKSRRNHTIPTRQRSEVGGEAGRRNGVVDAGADSHPVRYKKTCYHQASQ